MRVSRLMYEAATVAMVATLAAPPSVSAQGWLKRIKDEAKAKVGQRTDQATDSLTDAAVDKAEGVVKCVASNLACIKKAAAAGQGVQVVNAQGQTVSTADSAQAMTAAGVSVTQSAATAAPTGPPSTLAAAGPGAGVSSNSSDFVPGTDVIWSENFATAPDGDFPRDVELVDGNMEAATWNGQHFIRATTDGDFDVPLPQVLPARFTLEFDFMQGGGYPVTVELAHGASNWQPGGEIDFDNGGEANVVPNTGAKSGSNVGAKFDGQLIHCQVMADGKYVKVYINGIRAANSPNADLGRSNKIRFRFDAQSDAPAYITNIRVAAGGKDMYQALSTEGRFTTHGILFATGSAAIDPASAATLTQIGQMLQQHPDLKLEIDGHTDNVGSAASNMTLSNQRAAAVTQYLVNNFQVDASRLTSKGFGASKPVASNDTAEGKAQNRRVELVKM